MFAINWMEPRFGEEDMGFPVLRNPHGEIGEKN